MSKRTNSKSNQNIIDDYERDTNDRNMYSNNTDYNGNLSNNYNNYSTYNNYQNTQKNIKNSENLTFSNEHFYSDWNKINNTNNLNNTNNYNSLNNTFDYNSSITVELRVSNIERRMENYEKMLKFYEDMLRLKDEEKRNEYKIDQGRLNELSNKLLNVEDNMKNLYRKLNEQEDIINMKIEDVEKQFNKLLEMKNNLEEFYAERQGKFENILKQNDVMIESIFEQKIFDHQSNIDNKFDDILNLIQELSKTTENNEYKIVESKESMRMIQNDHVDLVKIISVLKEKSDSLDFVMNQITDLKQKYSRVIQIYGEQSIEEDKFFNKILNTDT
jgi:hypothetical protein